MSDPQPFFTVTLTAAEVQSLRDLHEKSAEEWCPWSGDARIFAALDAAKPVRATRLRATPAAAEPFTPNTGNAAVDEFMRRKHDPKWKPLPLPKAPGLPPLRPLKVSEADAAEAAEAAWNAACEEARAAVASGKPSEAETVLRELIARHRNPWTLDAVETARENGETIETRILTSARHPGMAIHEIKRWGGARGFVVGDSKTWRVMAGGILSEKVHYAAAAAELEADEARETLT